METWKSLLAVSLLLGTGACGGGGGDDDDTVVPDANPDIPDANPTQTRSATLAVTDIALTSDDGVAQGWKGGSISLVFDDITTGGGEVKFGTSPVGGCVVVQYDATHPKHPTVDAGTLAVAGDGLLKTVGPCNYQEPFGYTCVSNGGSESISGTSSQVSPFVTYTFSGTPFAGEDLVGSYLSINGFVDTALNTGAQPRPILVQTDSSLTVISTGVDATPATAEAATAAFAVINGAGPIPTQVGLGTIDADFLGGAATNVTMDKDANAEWGAIAFTSYTRGEGFALADASAQPHEFPDVATDPMSFTCTGTGGDCGEDGDGTLEAIIISGKTTDADVSGLPDFIMPPATTWAEFQCGYLLADSGSIPSGALQAILDTNPTRVETRVLRLAGENGSDSANPLNTDFIVVGHGFVGHTTMPPN